MKTRPPIIPQVDYVFQVEGAKEVSIRQGSEELIEAVSFGCHQGGSLFVLHDFKTVELEPGTATFLCSAPNKKDWSFSVVVTEALPEEF